MGRHATQADDSVLCVYNGTPGELVVGVDGKAVVLRLPDGGTVRLTLKHYDRLKHQLIIAGNEASWADTSERQP